MQECPHTFNLTRLSPRKIKCILTSLLLNFTPIDSYLFSLHLNNSQGLISCHAEFLPDLHDCDVDQGPYDAVERHVGEVGALGDVVVGHGLVPQVELAGVAVSQPGEKKALHYRESYYDWPNSCISNCYNLRQIIMRRSVYLT